MSGGGSSAVETTQSGQYSSSSELPAYLKQHHEDMLEDAEDLWLSYLTASPFSGDVAYDPTTYLAEVASRYTEMKTYVDGIATIADWEDIADAVNTKLDSLLDALRDTIDDIVSGAMTNITSAMTTAVSDANTNGASIASAVDTVMTDKIKDLITGIDSDILSAITSVESGAGIDTIDAAVISDAVTAATAAMGSSALTTAADEYEDDIRPAFLRSVGRFTAGMADINAVHSTSFVLGVAMLEHEFDNKVNDFLAKLKLQTYQTGYEGYIRFFQDTLLAYIQNFVQLLVASLSSEITMRKNIEDVFTGALAQQIDAFKASFSSEIEAVVNDRQQRAQYFLQSVAEAEKAEKFLGSMEGYLSDMSFNMNKMRIEKFTDQTDKQMQIDEMDTKWPFYLMAFRGDMLSTINGAPMNSSASGSSMSSRGGGGGGDFWSGVAGVASVVLPFL